MIRRVIPFFILFFISQTMPQGSIVVNSTIDRDHILIGDVITYSVIVERDADVEVLMPSLAENLGMFEIRNYDVHEPHKVDGKTVEQTDYSISTFDTGEFVIPELEINYRIQGDSTWQVIKTEPIDIFVESLNPDEAGDIRDIKPPLTPPRDYRTIILMSVLGVLVIAAILFTIYYIKRIREGKSIIPKRSTPPRPAHEIAFEALDALKKKELPAQGKIKDYYTEVSDIVRQYIQNRYFILAMEKTTTELLAEMSQQNLSAEQNNIVRSVLTLSDLVKFAKFIPPAEEHEKAWQDAYNYVETTKLIFEPEETIGPSSEEETGIVVEDEDLVENSAPIENDEPQEMEGKEHV